MSKNQKILPTEVKAVYRGDQKTVASEAKRKKPDNPEEVIARNTQKIICANENEPICKKQCNC